MAKEISRKRFNALAGRSRSPFAGYISRELAWYSNEEETILGVSLLDTVDEDYSAVLLGKDGGGRFRAFDLVCSLETQKDAEAWLTRMMMWHTGLERRVFPQGDELERGEPLDLFTPVVPPELQHPYFVRLNSDAAFAPAKALISRIMPHFTDIDGNFVEQFQTQGFDGRLWELFIDCYLSEEELFVNRKHSAPDFMAGADGQEVAIEAVIVGRREDNPPRYFKILAEEKRVDVRGETENAMPIRYGSPLYSKLKRRYWELPHVAGKPLLFAIADFHDDQSMIWSHTSLINYLYGVAHDFHYDPEGQLVITPHEIEKHKVGMKEIPSGFFFQEEAENISGVLFSATGTISKFNRLGRQAGFASPDVVMIRWGTCHDHDPNASGPRIFHYIVDENSEETWAEGVSLYHNPNAKYPVQEELFPSIAHHRLRDGQIVSHLPEFHPYASLTLNMRVRKRR